MLRHRLLDAVEVPFGNRELHIDRLDLSDDDERSGSTRLHKVADIDEPQPGNAVDWRGDFAIGDIELSGVALRLIALDRCLVLLNSRTLGVVLLACHRHLVADDCRVAGQVALGVFEVGLILGFVRLGLLELRLRGPRVDLHQQIALMHVLAFGKSYFTILPSTRLFTVTVL